VDSDIETTLTIYDCDDSAEPLVVGDAYALIVYVEANDQKGSIRSVHFSVAVSVSNNIDGQAQFDRGSVHDNTVHVEFTPLLSGAASVIFVPAGSVVPPLEHEKLIQQGRRRLQSEDGALGPQGMDGLANFMRNLKVHLGVRGDDDEENAVSPYE
jgi:hypothetical protein